MSKAQTSNGAVGILVLQDREDVKLCWRILLALPVIAVVAAACT